MPKIDFDSPFLWKWGWGAVPKKRRFAGRWVHDVLGMQN